MYFQRYIRQLPNIGELVFFDRSWYNRAVVEPVNDFCTRQEYDLFMRHVPEFEMGNSVFRRLDQRLRGGVGNVVFVVDAVERPGAEAKRWLAKVV